MALVGAMVRRADRPRVEMPSTDLVTPSEATLFSHDDVWLHRSGVDRGPDLHVTTAGNRARFLAAILSAKGADSTTVTTRGRIGQPMLEGTAQRGGLADRTIECRRHDRGGFVQNDGVFGAGGADRRGTVDADPKMQ